MIIHVKVRPNSKEEKIEKIAEGKYAVSVKEPAEDNKANMRIVNILSKEFKVDFRKIRIKNPASREKIMEVDY